MCSLISASQMCDEDILASTDAEGNLLGGDELCSHPCIQEMVRPCFCPCCFLAASCAADTTCAQIDCIDSPTLAESRDHLLMMRQACGTAQAECMPLIADLGAYFDAACCSGAGLPPCPDTPPSTCTTGCAAMYLPFWRSCGGVLEAQPALAEPTARLREFAAVCEAAHPGAALPPPPPARPPAGGGH